MKDYLKKAMRKAAKEMRVGWGSGIFTVTANSENSPSVTITQYTQDELKDLKMDEQNQSNEAEELVKHFSKLKKDNMIKSYAESSKLFLDRGVVIRQLRNELADKDKSIENRRKDNLEDKEQIKHMRKTINATDEVLDNIDGKVQEAMLEIINIGKANKEGHEVDFKTFFYYTVGYIQGIAKQGLSEQYRDDDGY